MNVRFTTWLSESERNLLDQRAREMGTSVNYLVRMAVRQYLGMGTVDGAAPASSSPGVTRYNLTQSAERHPK